VIFAEPVTGNTNKQLDAALLPGDRLLEVNGQNVQNTNREDIIDIIRNSGSTVTLKVVRPLFL
jgi:myosin-18